MSVDTYFCFCCLSTSDLNNIFELHADTNYAKLLEDYFNIKPFQDEHEDDGYICDRCASILKHVKNFKVQILETLNVLQTNGLITIEKGNDGHIVVRKAVSDEEEQKLLLDKLKEEGNIEIVIEREQNEEEIKTENADTNETLGRAPDTKRNLDIAGTNDLSKTEAPVTLKDDIDNLKCRQCDVVLPNKYMLHKHMNVHFPNHICEACGRGFATEKKLKRHMISHNEGPYICSICDEQFNNYNSFTSHKRRKHDLKPAKRCVSCQRMQCTCRRSLPLYQCEQCEQKFYSAAAIYSHRQYSHNRKKRHFCQHCPDAFYFKEDLLAHEAMHTGRLPFKCNSCSKSYPRRKSLIVHMRTHTNDRRFSCDICGKRFVQKCTLITHLKVHNQKTDS